MVIMPENTESKMAPERKVPITKTDFHVLDEEFHSIKGRFDAEMKKMEEEMSRLRSRLKDNEPRPFSSTSSASIRMSSSSTEESTSHKTSSDNTWADDLTSPLIQDGDDGSRVLKLRFDVSDYAPEEILVKTIDSKLKVNAKHEEKSENKSVYREYSREFLLPKGTNPELIRSSLSKDGILTVEAPMPAIESFKERTIPIDKC